MAVRTIIADATAARRDVHLSAANEAVNEILTGLGIGRPEGRVRHRASRLEALRHAVSVLDDAAAASPRRRRGAARGRFALNQRAHGGR